MVTDQFPLELGTEGIREREDGEKGGAIIQGKRLFSKFLSKGAGGRDDCSRDGYYSRKYKLIR